MIASRTFLLGLGLTLAACGSQPQSAAAASDTAEMPSSAPSHQAAPTPSASSADNHDYTIDRTNKGAVGVVGDVLVRAGTLDGARITRFQLLGQCETVVTTARGSTTIDWRKVGNWAAHQEGDQRIIPIDDGNGTHVIGVPVATQPEPIGDAGARVEGGFGGFADSCQS